MSKISFDALEKAYEDARQGSIEPNVMVFPSIEAYKRFRARFDPDYDEFDEWVKEVRAKNGQL